MESLAQTEHKAAAWLARRDGGDWTEDDAAALQGWLDASTANRIAFLRLEAAWEETLRLKALTAGLPPGAGASSEWRVPVSFDERQPNSGARASLKGTAARLVAIAASVLVVVGVATYFAADWLHGDRFATPVGAVVSVPLQDGSKIML